MIKNKIGAIILAAGKGKRMNAKKTNKVTFMLGGKPMLLHIVHVLRGLNINPIVVVIGFAKESVKNLFKNEVQFAEQKKRLGTAHATHKGLKVLPGDIAHVFILNGDDSAFYTVDLLKTLLKEHLKNKNEITFLTLTVSSPYGLGRIVRDNKGNISAIVEEKDATARQRKIKEINPACYLFETSFLRKHLPKVTKSKVTNEYYLVSLIEMAIKQGSNIQGIKGGRMRWRGINTKEELKDAENLFKSINRSSLSI